MANHAFKRVESYVTFKEQIKSYIVTLLGNLYDYDLKHILFLKKETYIYVKTVKIQWYNIFWQKGWPSSSLNISKGSSLKNT
jgi:hypothetical protein